MLSLSPAKILVVLVIALIVLGPEKLPGVARQMGAAWGDLRRLRSRLESEVRGVFPDLPPAHEVAQAVRSPLAFLDRLADEHERSAGDQSPPNGANAPPPTSTVADGATANGATANGNAANGNAATGAAEGTVQQAPATPGWAGDDAAGVLDDPSMN
jgi:sec-independent protein translocase protein TatB